MEMPIMWIYNFQADGNTDNKFPACPWVESRRDRISR